jgi:hypothetical protein
MKGGERQRGGKSEEVQVSVVNPYTILYSIYAYKASQKDTPIIGPTEKPNIAKRRVRSKSHPGTGAPAAAP